MKYQHVVISFLIANIAMAAWWNIVLKVVNTIKEGAAMVCGKSIVSGAISAAAVSCAVTAVAAAIGAVAQATIDAKRVKRDNVDYPALTLNGKPTDLSNLPADQWLDVSYDDTPLALMVGAQPGEVSAGIDFGNYQSGSLDKRDSSAKDMYIEAQNITGMADAAPTRQELLNIASGVLEQGVAYPGEYRIHVSRPDDSASMDLLIRTGMGEVQPSFVSSC